MKKKLKLITVFLLMLIVVSACSSGGDPIGDAALNDQGDSTNVIVSTEGEGNVTKEALKENETRLTAQAAADYYFSHWEGDGDINNTTYNPITIDNTSPREVTAVFLEEENSNTDTTDENGVFKLINSWGESWGVFNDGSHYISYQAAVENNLDLYLIDPLDNYQPRALAVFKLDADSRENVEITFATESGSKKLYPTDAPYDSNGSIRDISVNQRGGSSAFPDNNLRLDITSLLPINDEITLTINNTGGSDIYLNNWQIEEYSSYPENPVSTDSNLNSKLIEAGSSQSFTMEITLAASASAQALSSSGLARFTRDYTEADWRSREKKELRTQSSAADADNNFGRGLKQLSAEQMKAALAEGVIKPLDTIALADDGLKVGGEASLDHSSSMYFPPVGNQRTEGSCASWSTVYYMLGFYQARDKGWDLSASSVSGVDQSQLMSPDFIYQLINDGQDAGSYYTDNLMMLANVGAASWAEMQPNDNDYLSWGNEAAWKKAAAQRVDYPIYYIQINNYTDIKAVKDLLDQGYLISTAIDSSQYSSSGIWTVNNYSIQSINDLDHANTVVGYDDAYQSSVEEITIR
jgi:C1A family cysteine protease